VLVDALVGRPPGQVDVWTVEEAVGSVLPERGVSHLMGLREVLLIAKAVGSLPSFAAVVTVGIESTQLGQGLSPAVSEGVKQAAALAADLLKRRSFE
jgi:hydrogenase maturation protease